MTTRILAIIIFALTTPFCPAVYAAPSSCSLSAKAINQEIKQHGVREMMTKLPGSGKDYSGYFQLAACISTGKKEWLDIAVPVITETPQDTEDDLTDAVEKALAVNPELVLAESWPDYFTIRDYICSVSVDDYNNYGDALDELNKRVAIVKQIRRPALKEKVDECLASFEQTKKELAHFYQVDKP